MPPERFPHDKDDLLREVDVRIRLRDIRQAYKLKDRLEPKWWETGVIILQFAAALGVIASLLLYTNVAAEPLNRWMIFWFTLLILTVVLSFEFLLVKIYNLRRANDMAIRIFEDLRNQLEAQGKKIDQAVQKKESAGDEENVKNRE